MQKKKNSDKLGFDAPIDLKTLHKEDIDMKNNHYDFLQNLTPWRHKTPDGVFPAPIWQPWRHYFILEHANYLKRSHKLDID